MNISVAAGPALTHRHILATAAVTAGRQIPDDGEFPARHLQSG